MKRALAAALIAAVLTTMLCCIFHTDFVDGNGLKRGAPSAARTGSGFAPRLSSCFTPPDPVNGDVLERRAGRVTDAAEESLVLLRGEAAENGVYFTNVRVEVYRADGRLAAQFIPRPDSGFQPSIELVDFAGNGTEQIFFAMASGGSGAFGYYYVYGAEGGAASVPFDYEAFSARNRYAGRLVNGFRAEITGPDGGEVFRLDISLRPKQYLSELYQPDGTLKQPVNIDVSPLNAAMPCYNAGAGRWQLLIYQRITGLYSADAYGYMLTRQQYDGGRFSTLSTLCAAFGSVPRASVKLCVDCVKP